jgi:hypothetical protein
MGYTTTQLDTEQREGIRASYITGRFTAEDALVRIQNGGFSQLTREQAVAVLTQPITQEQVKEWAGKDVTEEQITARLAEVTA